MKRMQDITTASLLPDELLILAGCHENQEAERYRVLALRFLPYSTGLSRLSNMLAIECEQRLEEMALIADRLQCGVLPGVASSRESRVHDRHFFIVNDRMAHQAFAQAVIGEHHSLGFYRQVLEANATPQLHSLLTAFIDQKISQGRVLEESQELLLAQEHAVGYQRSA